MRSRNTSLASTLQQLEAALVDAVFDIIRSSAAAALDDVLTRSKQLPLFPNVAATPVRSPRGRRVSRGSARRIDPDDDEPLLTAAAHKAGNSVPPLRDDAPTITDPSVVLAEVQAIVQKIPPRRRRGQRSESVSRRPRVVETPPEEPSVAAAPPALREGEEVARAVAGGGVVLRRRRT